MTSDELRSKFLEFFHKRGHAVIPSSSLVPSEQDIKESDKTLFISAGMQQFKRFYTNPAESPNSCVTTCQKCIRTADIEEVGDDTHLTFFEMLGNFSFGYPEKAGSYFKKESIELAWMFLTKEIGFNEDRLHVTYFNGEGNDGLNMDTESRKLIKEITKLSDDKIKGQSFEDNFWSLGTEGSPGGPTVEFYVDNIEVWNLVFNEYEWKGNSWGDLQYKGVDTGMGLERLLAVINGKMNVYQTDLFEPVIDLLAKESSVPEAINYLNHPKDFRVIADHIKAAVFAINDGVYPSNKGAGYITRRLLRRVASKFYKFGTYQDPYVKLITKISDLYKDSDLGINKDRIINVVNEEITKFAKTWEAGNREIINWLNKNPNTLTLPKEFTFKLSTTYGFPLELIREIVSELQLNIDETGHNNLFKAHQELSRTASAGMFKGGLADSGEQTTKLHTAAHLLLAALRQVLGDHVIQRGSNITSERLRFDFSHSQKMTEQQIKQAEDLVNEQIEKKLPVGLQEMSLEEAKESGAMGVFESKYGDKVKVYTIGDFSKEICGGPHVKNTGELGHLKITKEESSSSGVRRIKAVLQ